MTLKSDFGNRLKEERKKLGFSSQAEVAEKCGVVKDVWGRYERGTSIPNGETLLAFMNLGADINYLFTGEASDKEITELPYLSDTEQDLLFLFRQIKNKQLALSVLESIAYKDSHSQSESLLSEIRSAREARRDTEIKHKYPERVWNLVEVAMKFKPRIEELGGDWKKAVNFLQFQFKEGIPNSSMETVFQSVLAESKK